MTTAATAPDLVTTEARIALEESEARYRTLADASFDGIAVSQDGKILDVNVGFLAMFGYKRHEVIGLPITTFCAPESAGDVGKRAQDDVEGTFEVVGQRRDGTRLTLLNTARRHVIRGRPARIAALRDITAQRQMESHFHTAQRMEAVGRLAGGIAHDFNNLLTVISASTEMLMADLVDGDPRRDEAGQIRESVTAAARLTRQLLAFSRQDVAAPCYVGFTDSIARAEHALGRLLGEDIQITSTNGATNPLVVIDPGDLDQILLTLAVNARDAMPDGGTLSIATDVVDLPDMSGDPQWPHAAGQFARLSMTDTGIGMSEHTVARMFEPFFTTKGAGVGTGLGLATVYGTVRRMGGEIRVRSEIGIGTTFEIHLPVAEPHALEAMTPAHSAPRARGKETILLVEDSTPVRKAIGSALEREGYRVIEAARPVTALELVRNGTEKIDLVLTDVMMPQMSGRRLAEEVRRIRARLPVMYMSGYADDTDARPAGHQDPFIQKPFTVNALMTKVRAALVPA